ncbi:MAG: helix-turn-helix domain-containing protein [Rhizomicrobium sp.]
MAESALGFLLRRLREKRNFSFRELAQLANIDHAYVYRLETGAKESPSDETLSKLIRALKAPKREAEMLRFIAAHPETDAALVVHVLGDPTVSYDIFTSAAGAAYRGTARPDYAKLIERIRRVISAEDSHG